MKSAFIAEGIDNYAFFRFQVPPEIISVDEALLLRFKSDDTINSKGFSASYVVIDEHNNFEDYSDVISRTRSGQ